jgi:hypothetical protein
MATETPASAPGRSALPDVLFVGLLVAAAGAYVQATSAGAFWDDHALIFRNPVVQELRLRDALFGNLWSGTAIASPYYRPLTTLSFLLDAAISGQNPLFYHVHSLIWHVIASAAMTRFGMSALGKWRGLLAGAIFALHPIQSEAVVWIAARNDLMCAAGIFGCLLAFERPGALRTAIGAGCALLAVLSKELGYLLPITLLATRWALDRPRENVRVGITVAFALLGIVLREVTPHDSIAPEDGYFGAGMGGLAYAGAKGILVSASWATVPWPLTSTASGWMNITPLHVAGAVLTVVVAGLLVRSGGRRALVFVGLALLHWAPTLLTTMVMHLIGERYLYVPIGFLGLAIASTVPMTRTTAGVAVAGVLAALTMIGVRVADWASERTLLEAALARAPDGHVWSRYGDELRREGDRRGAFRAYREVLSADPPVYRYCATPTRMLLDMGAYADAARLSDETLTGPCGTDAEFLSKRAMALFLAGRTDEVRKQLAGEAFFANTEFPVRAALCAMDGDLTCESRIALVWEGGPADLRDHVFDLLNPPRPAPKE